MQCRCGDVYFPGFQVFSENRQDDFARGNSRDINRYEVPSFGGLLGFSNGMILSRFLGSKSFICKCSQKRTGKQCCLAKIFQEDWFLWFDPQFFYLEEESSNTCFRAKVMGL